MRFMWLSWWGSEWFGADRMRWNLECTAQIKKRNSPQTSAPCEVIKVYLKIFYICDVIQMKPGKTSMNLCVVCLIACVHKSTSIQLASPHYTIPTSVSSFADSQWSRDAAGKTSDEKWKRLKVFYLHLFYVIFFQIWIRKFLSALFSTFKRLFIWLFTSTSIHVSMFVVLWLRLFELFM